MSNTLVVSDNEFLNILFLINLEVYLATKVDMATNLADGVKALKSKKKYDLVIALDRISNQELFENLLLIRGSYGLKSSFIKLGGEHDGEIDAKTFVIASKYNIQPLLKRAASILNVTAKQMAEMKIGKFYPLSLGPMRSLSKVPCNIFFESEGVYEILVKANEPFDASYKKALEGGIEHVYVKSADRLVVVNYVSLKLIEKITDALKNSEGATLDKKVEMLNDGYEFAIANLFSSEEIKQEMQEIASASAKVMQDVVKDNANLKGLITTLLSNQAGYIFTHSMIASYVANHIIKNVTWGGESQSEKINFVLFFHDIYLAPLYLKYPQLHIEKNILASKELTDKEKDLVMNHAKLAAELVVTYKRCPMGSDILIKQHHGSKKGTGFAFKYPEDLSPISKILVVAESFVEEFMKAQKEDRKVEMKLIIPKLIEEFGTQSYIKIVQTLVTLPL